MTVILQEVWSAAQVLAPWALVAGDKKRVTLDLSNYKGAFLKIAIGGGGNTTLTDGVDITVARLVSDAAGTRRYAAHWWAQRGMAAAHGLRQINNAGGYAAGSTAFAFDGSGGTLSSARDKLFFWGVTSIPTASGALSPTHGCEVLTVSKGTTTPVTVCEPCAFAKLDDEYFCQAESWELWLPGGRVAAITLDYGNDSAGEAVGVMIDADILERIEQTTV